MNEFVGLRPKLYSFKMDKDKSEIKKYEGISDKFIEEYKSENKKCKGITEAVIKKITHKNYKDILFENYKNRLLEKKEQKKLRVNMNVIRPHKREVYTERVNKIALSDDDDKGIICNDNVSTTYALGHYNQINK